jgi:competence protein ComEC
LLRSSEASRVGLDLDLGPPVRLDLWAILLAAGVAVGTVDPPLAPVLVVASAIVATGAVLWRDLVPPEWRLMAVLGPLFAAGGVAISLLHAATPDPLAKLAAMEPGEVILVGRIASPPEQSSFGYRADLRVEHLWYEGSEVLRGGGVEVFAGDLSVGVGDRVRVDGEISLPQAGEDGFDYERYLGTNSELLRVTLSPKTPLTSRLLSGYTETSSLSIL